MNNETLQQLADAIAQRMQPQPQPASQAAPVTAPQAGQPAPISWAPAAQPTWGLQPQVYGPTQFQPTGVSVPVIIPWKLEAAAEAVTDLDGAENEQSPSCR